jgi:hypothetical protein
MSDDRMINECGAVDGMIIGRGNRTTWRRPVPLPLCPSEEPVTCREGVSDAPHQWITALDGMAQAVSKFLFATSLRLTQPLKLHLVPS